MPPLSPPFTTFPLFCESFALVQLCRALTQLCVPAVRCPLTQLCIPAVRCVIALGLWQSLSPLRVRILCLPFLVSQNPVSTSLQGSQFLGCIFIVVGSEPAGFPVLQVAVLVMSLVFFIFSFRGSHLVLACVLLFRCPVTSLPSVAVCVFVSACLSNSQKHSLDFALCPLF